MVESISLYSEIQESKGIIFLHACMNPSCVVRQEAFFALEDTEFEVVNRIGMCMGKSKISPGDLAENSLKSLEKYFMLLLATLK